MTRYVLVVDIGNFVISHNNNFVRHTVAYTLSPFSLVKFTVTAPPDMVQELDPGILRTSIKRS